MDLVSEQFVQVGKRRYLPHYALKESFAFHLEALALCELDPNDPRGLRVAAKRDRIFSAMPTWVRQQMLEAGEALVAILKDWPDE